MPAEKMMTIHRPSPLEKALTKVVLIGFSVAIAVAANPLAASLYQGPLIVNCSALASGHDLRIACVPLEGHAVYADKLRLILDGSLVKTLELPEPEVIEDELGRHEVFVGRFEMQATLEKPATDQSKVQLRYRACKLGDYCLPPAILSVPVI